MITKQQIEDLRGFLKEEDCPLGDELCDLALKQIEYQERNPDSIPSTRLMTREEARNALGRELLDAMGMPV